MFNSDIFKCKCLIMKFLKPFTLRLHNNISSGDCTQLFLNRNEYSDLTEIILADIKTLLHCTRLHFNVPRQRSMPGLWTAEMTMCFMDLNRRVVFRFSKNSWTSIHTYKLVKRSSS